MDYVSFGDVILDERVVTHAREALALLLEYLIPNILHVHEFATQACHGDGVITNNDRFINKPMILTALSISWKIITGRSYVIQNDDADSMDDSMEEYSLSDQEDEEEEVLYDNDDEEDEHQQAGQETIEGVYDENNHIGQLLSGRPPHDYPPERRDIPSGLVESEIASFQDAMLQALRNVPDIVFYYIEYEICVPEVVYLKTKLIEFAKWCATNYRPAE